MPLPVISIAQMREWEKATWDTGQTEIEVIRRVGKRVAALALKMTQPGDLVLILAGKGHNGEDARSAREYLAERRVDMLDVTEPVADYTKLEALLSLNPALIIDGLFGIGLTRPLSTEWVHFINRVNQAKLSVLAVDVPSGLNADTGKTEGAAICASVTLTVGAPKEGMLRESAWHFVGRLEIARDVGLAKWGMTSETLWTVPEDFGRLPPARAVGTHKNSCGHLGIVAGSRGYHGAAVLAARGAQRAQPGLITLLALESVYPLIASQCQAVMVSPMAAEVQLQGPWTALLIGPGLAGAEVPEGMVQLTRRLWRDWSVPLIVDASGLAWLQAAPVHPEVLRIMTPHPGEAARLLGITSQKVQADRPKAVRELSRRFGDAWVVLKGHQTLIGRSQGELFVNSSGNPHLAQGGSGDVLAGYIAGLIAQPAFRHDIGETLRYAVWQHGAAADRLQERQRNWVIEDLVEEIGR